jgi:phosphoserine phosphatase
LSVLVVLDVDSTLIQQEVIELLAEHAGVGEHVKEITDQAMAGELDFKQSLEQRVNLLAGISQDVFAQVSKDITMTPGATELIDAVHQIGGRIGAVSGGFSAILDDLAKQIGLDYWQANHLEVKDGLLTGKVSGPIVDASAKAEALNAWAEDFGIRPSQTIAVGDGANDIAMLQAAGFAIAFRPKEILRQYADLVIEENSLLQVIEKLSLRTS